MDLVRAFQPTSSPWEREHVANAAAKCLRPASAALDTLQQASPAEGRSRGQAKGALRLWLSATTHRDEALPLEKPSVEQPAKRPSIGFAAPHSPHGGEAFHHHHSHADGSRHVHDHHLLNVEHLSVSFRMYDPDEPFFRAKRRLVNVIDDLSVSVHEGEILAIVGASGSGKTLLADAIMGLFEPNALVRGSLFFDGEPMDARRLAKVRGRGISFVPQSVANLDPLMKVGRQVQGFGRRGGTRAERIRKQRELFERYGLAPEVADMHPFELSGGMARRVLLCCALMESPKLIVADEPTPGLDLDLAVRAMDDFREFADAGGGVLLVTHDIELALRVADRIAVFQNGTVVEETAVASFASPDLLAHPFSRALWHALPEHGFTTISEDAANENPLAIPSTEKEFTIS